MRFPSAEELERFLAEEALRHELERRELGEAFSHLGVVRPRGSADTLLFAFKAIEAIVGDPPKSDSRFFASLRRWGVDPAVETGIDDGRPLHKLIRAMSTARDREAAHGASPSKGIGAYELYEYQQCAGHILQSAVTHCLAGRVRHEDL